MKKQLFRGHSQELFPNGFRRTSGALAVAGAAMLCLASTTVNASTTPGEVINVNFKPSGSADALTGTSYAPPISPLAYPGVHWNDSGWANVVVNGRNDTVWNNLVDSLGNATSVSWTNTPGPLNSGTPGQGDTWSANGWNPSQKLIDGAFFYDPGTFLMAISGLTPSGHYQLAFASQLGINFTQNPPTTCGGVFTITDSTFTSGGVPQTSAGDVPANVSPNSTWQLGHDYVLFFDVVADASGSIFVSEAATPGSAQNGLSWGPILNGMQIVDLTQAVPEPDAAVLLGIGAAAFWLRRSVGA